MLLLFPLESEWFFIGDLTTLMSPASHLPFWLATLSLASGFVETGPTPELTYFDLSGIFLNRRIVPWKRASRIPSDFDGFTIKLDGSEMILTKIFEEESVEIKMNLTHSVDTELHDEPDMKPDEQPELKSKPHFEVKLVKGDKVTRFACSYVAPEPESPDSADVFTIDELAVYEGTLNDQTYAVSGDVLDGYMYDLLMNLLEERGVSNAFVDKLSGLATKREHELYVKLLQKLQDFVKGE
nr:EOG090X0APE [Leptodora kindtii]